MIKSGVSLVVAGVSLVLIGTVVSPVLHQSMTAVNHGGAVWRTVDRIIAASGGILSFAGLVMTVIGIRVRSRPVQSPARDTAAADIGVDRLAIAIGIIAVTTMVLSVVLIYSFKHL